MSICEWFGVICSNGRVTKISLGSNRLGTTTGIPAEIGQLTELTSLKLSGSRPGHYKGCSDSNFHNTSIPDSLYSLVNLTKLDLAYTCRGGTISPLIGGLKKIQILELHGNYISGTIPQEVDGMANMREFKLGRNPIIGTLLLIKTFSKVSQ